jgi:hypothetical protein
VLRSLLLAKHSELVAQQERLLSRDSQIEHLKRSSPSCAG